MDLSQNLKKTEIGIIPSEWSISYLDEVSSIGSGKRLPLGKSLSDKITPHPYIRVTDMNRGSVELSGIKYVPEDVYPSIKNYRIFCNDIFISVAGNGLGQVGKIPKELDGANLTENANRIYNLKCSQNYLLHVMASPIIQKVIAGTITVGAQPKLALTRIRKFKIPLPPTNEEQQAIAAALSDVDEFIDSIEKLRAKKCLIKKGVMQVLLTGKRRLSGFTKPWTKMKIGDLGSFLKGKGIKKDESNSGSIPCVRYGEIYTDHDDIVREFRSFISAEVASQATKLKTGDILFAGSGETKEEIGKCVAYTHTHEAFAGGDIVILRPTKGISSFLGYYLNSAPIILQKASRGQGDAIVHISAVSLGTIEILLPDETEQSAIAEIFLDIDSCILELEKELSKARLIKQGMMQELLTGRIRLV